MAIDITITQTGFFKKPLTEDILSPAGLRVDDVGTLAEAQKG